MAVLKKYKEFKYWDIIEEIYSNDKISEASRHYTAKNSVGVPDIIHIIREYPENIKRTYCKCGYTSGNINHNSCPKCGNENLLTFHQLNGYRSLLLAYNCEVVDGDPVLLKTTNYKIYPDKATNEFILEKCLTTVDFEIYEDYVKEHKTESVHKYDLNEIKKHYKYSQDFFDLYKNQTVMGFLRFVESKSKFPVIHKNFDKIPNLGNLIYEIWEGLSDIETIKSLDELFLDILEVPNKSLIPYIDKLYEKDNFRMRWSYHRSTISRLLCFDKYDFLKTEEIKKTINHLVMGGMFSCDEIGKIINDIVALGLDEKTEILLSVYIRSNYIVDGVNVVNNFKEDAKYLEHKGYSLFHNLDKRTVNILRNLDEIECRKYNPKKATFILDMFELNPLESLQYLDNRRAPNKQLREELRERLD